MADNYVVRDGNGNPLTVKSKATSTNDVNGNPIQLPQSAIGDATGTPFADANPLSTAIQARPVTYIDRSAGTSGNAVNITTSSGQILAANASRRFFTIQNLDLNNFIYINFGAAATTGPGSICVPPLSIYESPVHGMPTSVINAISSAGTVLFTAKESN